MRVDKIYHALRKGIMIGSCILSLTLAVTYVEEARAVHSKRVVSTARGLQSVIAAPVMERTTILFIIDGCRADILYRMIESGSLPVMRDEVSRRGVTADIALTCIPSTTFSGITTLLTGIQPGKTGITGNRWFDRTDLTSRSYLNRKSFYRVSSDTNAETIFQVLDPMKTATIFTPVTRGSSFNIPMDYNYIGMGNYLLGRWEYVDRVYAGHIDDVVDFADRSGSFPTLLVLHMPSTDHVGHASGNKSEEYERILQNFDLLLGEILELFEVNGLRDKISVIITADHGQVTVGEGRHVNIGKELRKTGFRKSKILGLKMIHKDRGVRRWLRGKDKEKKELNRSKKYERCSIIHVANGRCGYLYLKGSLHERGEHVEEEDCLSWVSRPLYEELRSYPVAPGERKNLIDDMLNVEGVGFVVCSSLFGTEIFSREGHSRLEEDISADPPGVKYGVIEGNDPLGYKSDGCRDIMDGEFHQQDEWLKRTADSNYPGVIPQLIQLLNSERCGDIVLFAAGGWDFEPDQCNAAAHGGIERNEMRIPLLWSGPDIRKGRIGVVQSIDILPTIAEYLGVPSDKIDSTKIEGTSFLNEIISR